ncbi:MAG: family 16 glycosylhydrolase [Novosphingobium sp.]
MRLIRATSAFLAGVLLSLQLIAMARPANGWDETYRGRPIMLQGARLVYAEDFKVPIDLRGPILWAGQHADFGGARFDQSGGYAYGQRDGVLALRAYRGPNGVRGANVQSTSAKQAYQGKAIVSGKRGFTCAGCYWEARIRFPRSRGTWGGFWLLTADNPRRRGHLEVDVIEYYGLGDAKGHHHSLHTWSTPEQGGHRKFGDYTGMDAITDFDWHRYAVDLRGQASLGGRPAAVIFVDGLEVARIAADQAFFEKPFYFLLTATITQNAQSPSLPQEVLVDYVKSFK